MGANGGHRSNTLEKYGWSAPAPAAVEKWLFAEGYQFDFFQAVRLLEMIQASTEAKLQDETSNGHNGSSDQKQARVSPGEGADPSKEVVHFSSAVSLDFPASDIAKVNSGNGTRGATEMVAHFKKREMPAEMSVNFLGLAGCLGTLDMPTTELVLQRASRNDEALKDFLDIFNHRLISLLYRIRKHHRVGLETAAPGEDQISRYLYSIIGLGTPNLKGRMHVRDRALLYYAGILAQQTRSMVGLERLLADYFQIQVKGRQFVGQWCELEESQWTLLGTSGQNQRLGRDMVVLGTTVWDEQARFEIHLGPLSLEQFTSFLATGWRFGALCDLIRFYVKNEFDFSIRLILKAAEIPWARLQASHPELSWTSWLGSSDASWSGGGVADPPELSWASWLDSSEAAVGNVAGPPEKKEDPYITLSPDFLRADEFSINSLILYRLPRGKQSELLAKMEIRKEPRNTVVMLQGEPATSMYVIRRGKVQISRREGPGKETAIGILGEGDSFGEGAMLKGKPYSKTALTLTECEIYTIDREKLDKFVAEYPELQQTIAAYSKRGESSRKSELKLAKVKR